MFLKDIFLCSIRKYRAEDRAAVRAIACLTALMGEPGAGFFDDDEIMADALTLYFTDYETESCFVAECDGRVIGYVFGAKDVRSMQRVVKDKIVRPLLIKAFRRGTFLRIKNLKFLFHVMLSALKGEFRMPSFSMKYPATLHINIIREHRGVGLGARMIDMYLTYLKAQAVKGVHFATMSEKAGQFYTKHCFQLLFQGHRSYYRYFLAQDVSNYIYGMRLSA